MICGNRELASEVSGPRVEVVPTAVDCDVFRRDAVEPAREPVVGWVGHSDNLPSARRGGRSSADDARRAHGVQNLGPRS